MSSALGRQICLFSLAALGFLVLSNCGKASPTIIPTQEYALSFLALGDSYTIGENVELNERWPVLLVERLREQGISIADPVIIASTGWTAADLLRGIERSYAGSKYDLVSLMIGVNDQYQELSIKDYRTRFRELLTFAISAADSKPKHVIVLSIPDWSFTPFGERIERPKVSEEIDAFNAVNREESAAAWAQYFDITPTTRPDVFDPLLFAEDGLHPSATMYSQWVDLVLPYVVALFASQP